MFAVPGFDAFPTPNRPHSHFVCFAVYDKNYPLPVAFPPEQPVNILAEVFAGGLAKATPTQNGHQTTVVINNLPL